MRPPHVYVPAPSVTGVFQIVSVQVEQPQYDETDKEGEGVGDVVGLLVGRVLGEDDGWRVGDEVTGRKLGAVEGDWLGARVG